MLYASLIFRFATVNMSYFCIKKNKPEKEQPIKYHFPFPRTYVGMVWTFLTVLALMAKDLELRVQLPLFFLVNEHSKKKKIGALYFSGYQNIKASTFLNICV